jgi:hypothetical protein
MKEKRTVVVTLRLKETIGEAARRFAESDRRPVSIFLAIVIEDDINAMLAEEKQAQKKGGKR